VDIHVARCLEVSQANNAFSAPDQRHNRYDRLLGVPGKLSRRNFAGFAACEVERFIRHSLVEQHHVSGLQCPRGAQRQQVRFPSTDIDQRDGAVLGEGAFFNSLGQQRLVIGSFRRFVRLRHRARREQLPEVAAAGERKSGLFYRLAPTPCRLRPVREAGRDQRLDLAADRLREDRRCAVGRNADYQRRAVDDGAKREIAEIRFVDHVHRNAGRPRSAGETHCFLVAVTGSNRHRGCGKIVRHPRAAVQGDRSMRRGGRDGEKLFRRIVRINIDMCAGRRQQFGFPGSAGTPAGHQRALALQRKEYRQTRQFLHAS
jgi:hypothetical protein